LEKFPAGQEENWENFSLQTGTPTDSKRFCENSGLGKGISGKAPGLIKETYVFLARKI
jgi:hypothetical protein